MFAYLKFRLQRQLRRFRRDLRLSRLWCVNYFNRHVWGKWRQLGIIRRFVFIWWVVIVIALVGLISQVGSLDSVYLSSGPRAGGVYSEGLVGSIKTINPILPESQASSDVSRLLFSGLTRLNAEGVIEADLARSWEVSADGKTYSFHLRPGVKWHDGQELTAQDVLFTMNLIQNPDTRSPLASSWQGIKAEAKGRDTINFSLPNPFAPFIYSTTFGILPQHALTEISPASLRVADFNQNPIGTGPFKFLRMDPSGKSIELAPNKSYYLGAPLLEQFEFHLFDNDTQERQAYAKHQINAIGQIHTGDEAKIGNAAVHELTELDEVGLFMHTTSPLLGDKSVRQAITQAVDRTKVSRALQHDVASTVALPILPGEIGYSAKDKPPGYDPQAAASLLDNAGWQMGDKGLRRRDGQPLKLKLVTAKGGNYPQVADVIKADLEHLGLAVDLILVDTKELQQSYIRPRNYDLLLYGISIGPDPDVYSYWHSSQVSDPGLNLSQYNSPTADKALEAGRLTTDVSIRAARYEKFLSVWSSDLPAVMLYMPSYLYITSSEVKGVVSHRIGAPSDRFYGVEKWSINSQPIQRGR